MKGFAVSITIALAALLPAAPLAVARSAAPSGVNAKTSAAHKSQMHPHQLTLYPHGKPERRQPAHRFTRHRFDQPTPIHNTFMGPRY